MKYIFIDSNQYRHIFSEDPGFSDTIYDLLIKLCEAKKIKLLLPQQTKEEVERNKHREWPEGQIKKNSRITELEKLLVKTKEFSNFEAVKKLKEEIEQAIENEKVASEEERRQAYKFFGEEDNKQNKKLYELFEKAHLIDDSEEIAKKADLRHKKGNPPYETGNAIGDALIWESLVGFLATQPKPLELIFVANDQKAWGDIAFDKWLETEFQNRTGGKIQYSHRLADIKEFTERERKSILKKELLALKQNAVSDFVDSTSFTKAGDNAEKLLRFKKLMNEDDYKRVIEASITNHEIYQSFFTPTPLASLVEGEEGYVVREVETIEEKNWEKFKRFYKIDLKRQADRRPDNVIRLEDIPF